MDVSMYKVDADVLSNGGNATELSEEESIADSPDRPLVGNVDAQTDSERWGVRLRQRAFRRRGALSERYAFDQFALLSLLTGLLLAGCLVGANSLTEFSVPPVESVLQQLVTSSVLSLATSALFFLTGSETLRRAVARLAALVLVLGVSTAFTLACTAYTFSNSARFTSRQELLSEWRELDRRTRVDLQSTLDCCGFDSEVSAAEIARSLSSHQEHKASSTECGSSPCCHSDLSATACRKCDWCFLRWREKLRRALHIASISGLVVGLFQVVAIAWLVFFTFSVGILSHDVQIDTSGLESMSTFG